MAEMIEMGTISSRGQIAIPNDIRQEMGLKEGQKVLFFLENDTLLIKRVTSETFSDITNPLKEAMRKSGAKEDEVSNIIHRFRAKKAREK